MNATPMPTLANETILSRTHLLHGLNAMSRAHEADYFRSGHLAGATIAAYYLCRENSVEEDVPTLLAARIAENWLGMPLFAPVPDEKSEAVSITRIVSAMQDHISGVRQAGHNVILPTLALKAFREVPEAITSSRVDGIRRLIQAFQPTEILMDENRDLPKFEHARTFAEFVLSEFIDCTERFIGRGQGWSGHLLTYAKALVDLHAIGYDNLATAAEDGFGMYVRRIRLGPLDGDEPRTEHSPLQAFPTQTAYWERNTVGDWGFGHVAKYPHGFYGLMKLAQDQPLKERCLATAYRIF